MLAKRREVSGLIIPDKASKQMSADMGILLCAGSELDIGAGAIVLVHPDHGKRINGWQCGPYKAKNEVRMYGCMSPRVTETLVVPWDESILGVYMPETYTYRAIGRNVLLQLNEKRKETKSGLVLPDDLHDRDDVGFVLNVGSRCEFTRAGQTVSYNRRSLNFLRVDGRTDLAICPEDAIYGVYP